MKSISNILIALIATIGSISVAPGTASASSLQSGSALQLSIESVSPTSADLMLSAALTNPSPGQEVTFYVQTKEFSDHGWMALESTKTNSQGKASYRYTPTWTGMEYFGASIGSPGGGNVPGLVRSFEVLKDPPGVPPSVIEYRRPLSSVGGVLVKSLLAIVAILWTILLGSLAVVIWRIPRLAKEVATDPVGRKPNDQ